MAAKNYAGVTQAAREQLFSFLESGDMGWEITSQTYRPETWYSAMLYVKDEAGVSEIIVQRREKQVYIVNLDRLEVGRDDS